MRTPEQIIGKDALLQLVFEGYFVVPVEPSKSMIDAGETALEDNTESDEAGAGRRGHDDNGQLGERANFC